MQLRVFFVCLFIGLLALANKGSAQTINHIEYFIDNDPGFGSGTSVSFTASANVVDLLVAADVSAVSPGFHLFFLRTRSDAGLWSIVNRSAFIKDVLPAINVNKAEYFIDNDPGLGNGTDVTLTPGANIQNLVVPVNTASLSFGIHTVYIRTRDNNNNWSHSSQWVFVKDPVQGNLFAVEYFIDTDPGIGNATAVSLGGSPGIQSDDFVFGANVTGVPAGMHTLFVRTRGVNGTWALTNAIEFERLIFLPVELINFNVKASGKSVIASWQTTNESNNDRFEVERSTNGTDFTWIGKIKGKGNSSTLSNYQYTDKTPLKGTNYYRLRQVDFDGQFTYSPIRKVDMDKQDVLLALYNNLSASSDIIVRSSLGNAAVSVFDAGGRKIGQIPISNHIGRIGVSSLPNGIYLAVLEQNGVVMATEKFVVMK